MKQLTSLIGTWSGKGIAQYPTIDTIQYSEELIFSSNDHDPVLKYEQRTWVIDQESNFKTPIFWECGFIIEKDDGVILINSQKSGRMENMTVNIDLLTNGSTKITAQSKDFLNDNRMISSKRVFILAGERLEYEMYMDTTLVDQSNHSNLHLKSVLIKKQ